jgi:3-phenylpropionate/cinnamic acid dioxygenase small subunit
MQAHRLPEFEQFLFREAFLLDSGRFSEWLELFTDDCLYWVPLEQGQADGLDTCSIIYDDKRLLEVRVRQTRHPRAHARAPASRTVHQVGNIMLLEDQGQEVRLASTLTLVEYRAERQRVFGATVEHRLRRAADGLRIALKRVDLVNSEAELDGLAFLF